MGGLLTKHIDDIAGCGRGSCTVCGKCKHLAVASRKKDLAKLPDWFIPERHQADSAYGIAFDIGTTTVAGILCDLKTGTVMDAAAVANPQSAFGADVISRIHYSSLSTGNREEIQKTIIDCLNGIISELTQANGIPPESVIDIIVAGNTTMGHLLLGVDASPLARAPFKPAFRAAVTVSAIDLNLSNSPEATVYLLPSIAGHVGADIVGVMLATALSGLPGVNLVIDIGTNGEIVLSRDGKAAACSTAAGPAFEGAAVYQGMRAATGAIESVVIHEGSVHLSVIGDTVPIGICGSGLIDAIAQLLNAGLLDYKGRMLDRNTALQKDIHPMLAGRLYTDNKGRGFILHGDEAGGKVVLTQSDIREVQLAKGAIAAGIKILMNHMGVAAHEINSVMIAGAFGSYVKTESALRIGLLPGVSPGKVRAIGNAAGAGACMALLSREQRELANREADNTLHIELSAHAGFTSMHMASMYFPI